MNTEQNLDAASVASVEANPQQDRPTFEYRIEKLGRQTTHYIKTNGTQFYFVRRPSQTDEQMRELGDWITQTLNFRIAMDTEPLPLCLAVNANQPSTPTN